MAAAAIFSEFSFMYVVRAVASTATSIDGLDSIQRDPVTIITGNRDLGSRNRKIRLQVVIECPLFPTNRVVALGTGPIKITAMRVFLFVAGNTLRLGVSKGLSGVAFGALLFAVFSE